MTSDLWAGLSPPYVTIVVDPPWDYPEGFATVSVTNGVKLGPINHAKPLPYSSMSVEEISRLPIGGLAAKDARLFLWTTNRYIPDAFSVLAGWGFRYKQLLIWAKTDGNMGGSVAPNSAEFLLVGVKGTPARIDKAKSSVIRAPQPKTHSVKPPAFGDLIEQVSSGPYVELFARSPRLGWDSWGYGYETGVA